MDLLSEFLNISGRFFCFDLFGKAPVTNLADRNHDLINLFFRRHFHRCMCLIGRSKLLTWSAWFQLLRPVAVFPCHTNPLVVNAPRAAKLQAMSELWEEDEALRKALPWNALTLRAPQKEMRQIQDTETEFVVVWFRFHQHEPTKSSLRNEELSNKSCPKS